MKKALFVLCVVVCLLFSLTSCDFIEWVFGNKTKYSVEGHFGIGDAKDVYIGADASSKGVSDYFMKITKNNNINTVPFSVDFPNDPDHGLMPYPTRIISLSEDYVLVVFGIPVYLVRTSDGYGVCLNQTDSKSYAGFITDGINETIIQHMFSVAPNGDVYFQVDSQVGNGNGDHNGIIIKKFSNSTSQLTESYNRKFSISTHNMENCDSKGIIVLVDERGNIATSYYYDFRGNQSCISIIKTDGSSEVFEIGSPFFNAFVGSDGLFHFYSNTKQVSFEVKEDGTIMKNESSVPSGVPVGEVVAVSGKNYCVWPLNEILLSDGLISGIKPIIFEESELSEVLQYDCSDSFLYILGKNLRGSKTLYRVNPDTNTAKVVSENYFIRSFTASSVSAMIDEIVIDGTNKTTKEEVIVSLIDSVETQISNVAGEAKDLTKVN